MPIVDMTSGHIDFLYMGRSVRIDGELLIPEGDRQHYVVYASSINNWLPPHAHEPLTQYDRESILASLVRELPDDRIKLEIDLSGAAPIYQPVVPERVEANAVCPRSGFWSSSAQQNSRRYFFQGEQMPDLKSDYGLTLWHWDADQSTPERR